MSATPDSTIANPELYSVELIAAQGHAVIVQRWPLDRTFWSTSTTKVDPVSPEGDPVLGRRRNVLTLSNGESSRPGTRRAA